MGIEKHLHNFILTECNCKFAFWSESFSSVYLIRLIEGEFLRNAAEPFFYLIVADFLVQHNALVKLNYNYVPFNWFLCQLGCRGEVLFQISEQVVGVLYCNIPTTVGPGWYSSRENDTAYSC